MFKSIPFKHLPSNLTKLPFKILLGVLLISFFLNYQPTLGFPPVKQNIAKAQTTEEQSQQINAQSLPFKFQLPHGGYITTHFSWFHPGIDIATELGTPIHPIAPGVVSETGFNYWGLGLMVVVDHPSGYQSLYAHMGKIYVTKGQTVTESDYLGEVGLTGNTSGPHTHLQISKEGKNIDPLTVLPTIH